MEQGNEARHDGVTMMLDLIVGQAQNFKGWYLFHADGSAFPSPFGRGYERFSSKAKAEAALASAQAYLAAKAERDAADAAYAAARVAEANAQHHSAAEARRAARAAEAARQLSLF